MPPLTNKAMLEINERADALVKKVLVKFHAKPTALDTLKIHAKDKSRAVKKAGVYHPKQHEIEINLNVIRVFEDPCAEYEDTLLHELAHAICAAVWPVRDFDDHSDWPEWAFVHHGHQWELVMRAMGRKPKHHLVFTARQKHAVAPTRYSLLRCPVCKREYVITKKAQQTLETAPGTYFECVNCKGIKLGASHLFTPNPSMEYFQDDVVI